LILILKGENPSSLFEHEEEGKTLSFPLRKLEREEKVISLKEL